MVSKGFDLSSSILARSTYLVDTCLGRLLGSIAPHPDNKPGYCYRQYYYAYQLSLLHTEKERFSHSHKPYDQVTSSIECEIEQKERSLWLEPAGQGPQYAKSYQVPQYVINLVRWE